METAKEPGIIEKSIRKNRINNNELPETQNNKTT
jgi:hypothetical protein